MERNPQARQAYDAEYLANKTALIEEINRLNNQTYYDLQQKIDALGLNMSLDIDMHLLTINTSELLACNTLAGGACAAGVSMRDKIAEMRQNMSVQYDQAMADYENAVRDVRDKAVIELDRASAYYDETIQNAENAVNQATTGHTDTDTDTDTRVPPRSGPSGGDTPTAASAPW